MTPAARPSGGIRFLFGDDLLRRDEAAREFVDLHLDDGTRDFNLDVLDGGDVTVEALASVLATPPMMAEWRVVWLRRTEKLAASAKAKELLIGTSLSPPPGLAFVMTATIPAGSRARFYQDLKKAAQSVEFPAVTENDVPGWLMHRARERHGLEITEEAARALGGAVGTDLGVLAQELEKLAELVSYEGPIELTHIEAAGTRLPQQDRWRWFDLVGERKIDEALRGLPVLLAQNESGVGLTSGLATHLLRLGVAHAGGARALEQILPGNQKWLGRRFADQARGWTSRQIHTSLDGLRRVDRLLKSSPFSERHLLEEWLLSVWAGESVKGAAT